MKTYAECVPCLVRQAVEAIQMATSDPVEQETAVKQVLAAMTAGSFTRSPVITARDIHHIVKRFHGGRDPYQALRARANDMGSRFYPTLKRLVKESSTPLITAIHLAAAGNIIDFGALKPDAVDDRLIENIIDRATKKSPVIDDSAKLAGDLASARSIWYVLDNCGELYFDRVLIEELPLDRVTCVVRGQRILNDATLADARETGLTDLVRVIDDGGAAPGFIVEDCQPSLREEFESADLVIVKGQGNFESLSGVARKMFFLLVVKCAVVSRDIGCPQGDVVIKSS